MVTDWLMKSGRSAAWLSLDEGDNDPVRFWTYLVAAIQTIHEEIGSEARQIVSAPQLHSAELAVISLLNDITELRRDLILVLDDYHLIRAGQIHRDLSYFLEHQPTNLHLILITRIDPPLSLARLRAYGQMMEIRAADLQFSTAEATILFEDVMNLQLNREQVAALHLRTEGWIVSLQLAALSLRGHPVYDTFIEHFTGSHHFILDYLTEEVLRSLPDAQRLFLLRTSILDRFCAALCHAVSGNTASQRLLDEIQKSNLFIISLSPSGSPDSSGRWFRYHHLFAGVLQAMLKRDYPDQISALHLKASVWFESEGYPDEAVDHALRSGDVVQARKMVLKHWMPALHRGEIATVLRWLDALPGETERDDPSLSLARCWALFISGQSSAVEPHLQQANIVYERLVDEGSLSGQQQNLVAAQLAMMRSVLARGRGEHAKSVTHAEEATRLIPTELFVGIGTSWVMLAAARAGAGDFDGAIQAYERGIALSLAEGNLIAAYGCIYGQAMYLLVQGRLNEAEELCRSTIERAAREGHGDFPAAGSLYIALARIALERNHLDEAEVHVKDGLRIALPGGFGEAARVGRQLRAKLVGIRGDQDTAVDIFNDTAQIVYSMEDPYLIGELNWNWAVFYLRVGDLDAAREKLHVMEAIIEDTQHANLILWHGWLYPRLLCAEESYKEALTALDQSIQRARSGNSNGELIHLLALQAVVLDVLGDRTGTRSALREALVLGASEGYTKLWLDAGPEIQPLLRDLKGDRGTSHDLHPYLDTLLDACQTTFGKSPPTQPSPLLDPLTPRELEIMRLICKGYTNPEIASELVVTINTIKKHTSNIYSKLEVRSRTQAIARAHDLGLV
jgi:LuxR family maltose regulon positive regulatory protein